MNRYLRDSLFIASLGLLGCGKDKSLPTEYPVPVKAERINENTVAIDRENDGVYDGYLRFSDYAKGGVAEYGMFTERGGILLGHDGKRRPIADRKFSLSEDTKHSLDTLLPK